MNEYLAVVRVSSMTGYYSSKKKRTGHECYWCWKKISSTSNGLVVRLPLGMVKHCCEGCWPNLEGDLLYTDEGIRKDVA